MKKILIVLLTIAFMSCTSNDDDSELLNSALVGEWTLASVSCFCAFPDPPNFNLTTVTFSSTTNEMSVLNSGNEVYFREDGTYTFSGDDTRITFQNGQSFDIEIREDRLLLVFVDSPEIADDEVSYSFVRN
ncbi:lipocalin family protein [Croceitalea marina]|uniref:Lipocalin family protein n=1 Tax=Croceitalea marina TaxID=1775166 RepID=A0ABW5MTI3_9FLAO